MLSGGFLWTATSGQRMHLYGGGDPSLGATVLRNYIIGIEWLRHRGVTMSAATTVLHGRGYQIDIVEHLRGCVALVEKHGGHLVYETAVEHLLTNAEGAVVGARTQHASGGVDVRARATVLATGGFANSAALRARYIHAHAADDLLLRCNPFSAGDGIRLATEVGGYVREKNPGFYGHLVSESPRWGEPHLFTMLTQYHSDHALLLNEAGMRFCDESLGDHTNTYRVLTQPGARAICLWDARIHERFATVAVVKGSEVLDKMQVALDHGGRGIVTDRMDAVAGFADAKGFNGRQLSRSVAQYNARCHSAWETLEPPRSENFGAIETPPYHALIVRPAITHTHGGIRVDAAARALRSDDAPIDGLLVAGADAGDVYGLGYAGGLSLALGFGIQAAQTYLDNIQGQLA